MVGRGNVSLAFFNADVKSLFSQNDEGSTPYIWSSALSSESFMDDISGRSEFAGMVKSVCI